MGGSASGSRGKLDRLPTHIGEMMNDQTGNEESATSTNRSGVR